MYKYYKDNDKYIVIIVITSFLSKPITHEYICKNEDEVTNLIVPDGHHIADPGLMITPTVVKGKCASTCVAENDKIHKGEKRVY